MASTTNADGTAGGIDLASRLTEMGNRTSLMVIDATLRAAPKSAPKADEAAPPEKSFAEAAAEVRALALRMRQATQDFQATICAPAE